MVQRRDSSVFWLKNVTQSQCGSEKGRPWEEMIQKKYLNFWRSVGPWAFTHSFVLCFCGCFMHIFSVIPLIKHWCQSASLSIYRSVISSTHVLYRNLSIGATGYDVAGFGCHRVPQFGFLGSSAWIRTGGQTVTSRGRATTIGHLGVGPKENPGCSNLSKQEPWLPTNSEMGSCKRKCQNLNSHIPKPEMTTKTVMVKELSDLITFVLGKNMLMWLRTWSRDPASPFQGATAPVANWSLGLNLAWWYTNH